MIKKFPLLFFCNIFFSVRCLEMLVNIFFNFSEKKFIFLERKKIKP